MRLPIQVTTLAVALSCLAASGCHNDSFPIGDGGASHPPASENAAEFNTIHQNSSHSSPDPAGVEPSQTNSPPALTDRWRDGTPDFLRLDDPGDRQAFRRWFTFLGESQAFRPPQQIPAEIVDCSALLRFAYRESLIPHSADWAAKWNLPFLPDAGEVRKYRYPHSPAGANLFRIRQAPQFLPTHLHDGSFAQFADVQTMRRLNTHLVTRDWRRALPGDLFFYHQLGQNLPFHAMIFLGASQFEPSPQPWVIYHTGPDGADPGEIRRRTEEELLAHPQPQWRPLAGNSNFLGVYRWNILRESD